MSWTGRPTVLTPEIVDLVQRIAEIRASLPTWDELEQRTGIKAATLRDVATGRTPKRLSRSNAEISS